MLQTVMDRTLPRLALAIAAAILSALILAGLAAASSAGTGHHQADTWTKHSATVTAAVSWGAKPAHDTWT